jgi:hypothetical protein
MLGILTSAGQILFVGLFSPVGQVIGSALTLVIGGMVWAILWNRQQRAAMKPGMASSWFIVASFVIALLGASGAMYGLGLRATSVAPEIAPNARSDSAPIALNYTKTEAETLVGTLDAVAKVHDRASEFVGNNIGVFIFWSRTTSDPMERAGPDARRDYVLKLLDQRDSTLEQLQSYVSALMKLKTADTPKQVAEFFNEVESAGRVMMAVTMYRSLIRQEKERTTGGISTLQILFGPANELLVENVQVFKQQVDFRLQAITSETTRIRSYLR